MAFRGSGEAARARIEALEGQVRELRQQLAQLPSAAPGSEAEEVERYYRAELDALHARSHRERDLTEAEWHRRVAEIAVERQASDGARVVAESLLADAYRLLAALARGNPEERAATLAGALERAEGFEQRLAREGEAAERARRAAEERPRPRGGDGEDAEHRRALAELEHARRVLEASGELVRIELARRLAGEQVRRLREIARRIPR